MSAEELHAVAQSSSGRQSEGAALATDDDETGGPAARPDLPLDVVFELLKNQRRRRVLRYLEEESGTVALGTLAESIAAAENDKEPRMLTSAERKRVYISLYQCHLPKLDDAGAIEFESNRGTVDRTDRTTDLLTFVDRVRTTDDADETADAGDVDEDRWAVRTLGVGLAGSGVYLVQATMFPSTVYSVLMMGGLVTLLLLTSLAQVLGF